MFTFRLSMVFVGSFIHTASISLCTTSIPLRTYCVTHQVENRVIVGIRDMDTTYYVVERMQGVGMHEDAGSYPLNRVLQSDTTYYVVERMQGAGMHGEAYVDLLNLVPKSDSDSTHHLDH